jgi:hypothetical protein
MAGGKLTALEVTKAKEPGLYGDGGDLYLQVTRDGKERISKSWIFRSPQWPHQQAGEAAGARDGFGLARYWTLSEARERARQQLQLLDEGKDPIEVRKAQDQASAMAARARSSEPRGRGLFLFRADAIDALDG